MNLIEKKYLYLLIILAGCINDKQKTDKQEQPKPTKINIEQYINNNNKFLLSDLTDTVRYVSLSTPSNIIIHSIRKIKQFKNYIFIICKTGVFQFDLSGSFIKQFSNKGRGPAEYSFACDFEIDENKEELIICGSQKILFFNIKDGSFKRKININTWNIASYDTVLCCSREDLGIEKVLMITINGIGDTISAIPNYVRYNLNRGTLFSSSSKIAYPFYKNNKKVYFRGEEDNDTVWQITTQNIKPHYILDLGKYKLPKDARPSFNMKKFKKIGKDYLGIPRMMEDNRYTYFTIKPRRSDSLFTKSIIYDKLNEIGYSVSFKGKPGIKDNILNGPNFWPYNISENYYAGTIEAYELIDFYNNGGYNIHTELRKQIKQLMLSSNSLVILCKKKKN